mmetsp:Transcript_147243/g.208914  ORF Transcript_147243/g.208914 Transcript_147243/m.208914 type:complete len:167 (+) Transcript_147243:78-578(+)
MIRSLFVVLPLALSLAENVPEVKPDPMAGLKVNDTSSTWSNFVYCKCGLTCAKQMGSWYVFNLGQSCACAPCPGENATVATAPTAALRGNLGQAPDEKPTVSTESQKLKSLELAEADPSEEAAWEAAAVRGSNLLYCRCGKGCAYGRQLGLYTYYCFRYGCKPCPK